MARQLTTEEFKKQLRKEFDEDVYFDAQTIDCWPTGIYALDKALGSGFPSGRMSLLVGKESTSKSTIAAKLGGVVSSTNYETGKMADPLNDDTCNVLFVDSEGTIDTNWCECHDYYPEANGNMVASTNTGNQAIDLITQALQTRNFSLIILDSTEALVPFKDLEKSSEDFVMGTKAKMMNAAYRTWQVAINESARAVDKWWQRPTLLVLNQLRDSISLMPAPPTIPSGIGQKQFSSTIVQMNTPKYADCTGLCDTGIFRGVVKKNKVAPPRVSFEYTMQLSENGDLALGEVDNIRSVLKDIRKYKLWTDAGKDGWDLFGDVLKKQSDFEDKLRAEPDYEIEVTRKVIEALK